MDISKGGYICQHIYAGETDAYARQFTGSGSAYNLICKTCAEHPDTLPQTLRQVTPQHFEDMDVCEVNIGQPQILERPGDLIFTHTQSPLPEPMLKIAAADEWYGLAAGGAIYRFDGVTWTLLTRIKDYGINEKTAFYVSPDGRFAAVVHHADGVVINLRSGAVTMKLHRGEYYTQYTEFPIAFFDHLLVHGTDWNRVDISNPETGELITVRESPVYQRGEKNRRYLDYFHAGLLISPDGEWIAEDGWMWHPIGYNRVWNLRRWLNENVWESEEWDVTFNSRGYMWDFPMCWIDNQTLAVWGSGEEDEILIDAVQLFSIPKGKLIRWFAGPKKGRLYFDTYLFSTAADGTDVWDVMTGERLLHDSSMVSAYYHPIKREFLTLLIDGQIQLSRLL